MEANGFKQRLNEALDNSEKIKIIFQYPSSIKAVIRKGNVIKVNDDSFNFRDRYDGDMTFSYDFICEISEWREV